MRRVETQQILQAKQMEAETHKVRGIKQAGEAEETGLETIGATKPLGQELSRRSVEKRQV